MATWSPEQKTAFRAEHPIVMPKKQPQHNYPHADVQSYFDALFASDHAEYKGMVAIATIKDSSASIIASVPAEQLGVWASQMHISTHMDYYYCKAQHTDTGAWGAENAFAHNAIYVDIDAHGIADSASGNHLIDAICYALPDMGIPRPNIIENSGRGYHLVWLIEQASARLSWMVTQVSAHFAEAVSALIAEQDAQGYSVDLGYSSNITGLTRIPGTFNTASGTYATYRMEHDAPMDLPKMYDTMAAKALRHTTHGISKTEVYGQHRVEALLNLASIRPIQDGYRDFYCLHLFSAAQMAGMGNQEALALVTTASTGFVTPLPAYKIERYLSTAARKRYKFTTKRIIQDLDINAEEQATIGLVPSKRDSNRARAARTAARKRNRDRTIMRFHILGFSVTAIAAKVHHAYNTVRKTIETYKGALSRLFSARELHRIFKKRIRAAVTALRAGFQFLKRNILCSYAACPDSRCATMSATVSVAPTSPASSSSAGSSDPPGNR